MTFRLLISEVNSLLNDALVKLNFPSIDFAVGEPPRTELGDVYSNIAFQLSMKIKKKPPELAREIYDKVIKSYLEEHKDSFIASAEPHPAGYLNFKANYAKLAYETLSRVRDPKYGVIDVGKGKRVLVEHTSVNPNKALHIGHVRNVVLGDAVYRILMYTNHETHVLNYVDDSGLQVADIIVGFKFANFSMETETKFDHYCGDVVYVKVNEMYEQDQALADKRRYVLREIEKHDSEIAKFARELTSKVLGEQLKTCWRLKARYDCLNFESQIIESKLWDKALESMKQKGIVKIEDDPESKYSGCLVIKAGIEGEEKVLLRSDGTATYIAKDIPYAAWKIGLVPDPFTYHKYTTQYDNTTLWASSLDSNNDGNQKFHGADKAITVIDTRQSRLQNIISKVLAMLEASAERYLHLSYEVVALSADTAKMLGIEIGEKKFAHMAGRKGVYINADDVLDALHKKAYEEAKQRNPDADDIWLNAVAESIAIAAIRYGILKQDLDKTITFDITESLKLEGDTGPYLQYAHARACRILEKAEKHQTTINSAMAAMLKSDNEIALIKEISKFDIHVEDSAINISPKAIARYAYSLATQFNAFYEKVPVLHEKNVDLVNARLVLVQAFVLVIRNALNLLGIDALEKM
ncbi:MAG: arginyl-tRNA synthetase [Candidatus Nitrosomirales archaeon]|jgi:arginyl-tRNA synthetase